MQLASLPRSLRKVACSPRILISSKVLFPLNRPATRNNALYVRVSLSPFSLFFSFVLEFLFFGFPLRASPRRSLLSASLRGFVLPRRPRRSEEPRDALGRVDGSSFLDRSVADSFHFRLPDAPKSIRFRTHARAFGPEFFREYLNLRVARTEAERERESRVLVPEGRKEKRGSEIEGKRRR